MIARLHWRDARRFALPPHVPAVGLRALDAGQAPLSMKLLALDTATEQMAVAVSADGRVCARQQAGGPAASAGLIPLVLALLEEAGLTLAHLDALACGLGPGAFTGLRTAVSVAQGLAFGAGKPVLGLDSLMILAEDALGQGADRQGPCWVAMDARMDEVYAAAYLRSGERWQLLRPPALYDLATLQLCWQQLPPAELAGNAMAAFGERLPVPAGARTWPVQADRAGALMRLAQAAWADGLAVPPEQALPVYVRDKVALTTAEREALKAGPP